MKIATYNVNSLRRRLPIVLGWLEQHKPDVFCLQETKVQDSEFPVGDFEHAGYHASFRGMKSYNGVATLSREKPEQVIYGFPISAHQQGEEEAVRLLTTVVNCVTIVNTYVPQGYQVKSEKYQFKLEWFKRLRQYFDEHLDPKAPAVWLGDLNVAPEPIDVYHPDRRVNDVDFHIDARKAYAHVIEWGLIDVFRRLHPERVQYTYWDYFRNALENNWGWRIDHIMANAPLADSCLEADVDMAPRQTQNASDHTVVWARFAADASRPSASPL